MNPSPLLPRRVFPVFLLLAGLSLARATSLVTVAENPNDFTSSLGGTSLYSFDNLKLGLNKNVSWDKVGTFDQLYVQAYNQYGGAPDAEFPGGSPYSTQSRNVGVVATTLTLNTPSSYFGFYWSAGDAYNKLQFFNGSSLVAEFTTASLMKELPKTYYGNPLNRRQNAGEPYAFINFYGDASTTWNRIVLTNNGTSGFESDNYTSRIAAWTAKLDGAITGRPVLEVNGSTVTTVAALSPKWAYEPNAPGAPAPPLLAVVAFGLVLGLRAIRDRKANRQG